MTEVVFQYFRGCPNWETTHERLEEAIAGHAMGIEMQLVESPEEAAAVGFRGRQPC